jgi:hypothetical protein
MFQMGVNLRGNEGFELAIMKKKLASSPGAPDLK